ncbi:MAG: MaoC family dehydratase [Pseudomonadota bacterium]
MTTLFSRESLPGLLGKTLGPGEWVEVTQERIDEFASASGDRQWIHVDVERARTGPFGTTIAHGLLTLSMIADLNQGMFKFDGFKMGLNYGYEKVRFPSTVPVGSRLRVMAKVLSFEPVGQMFQTIIEYTVEREGADKPACVAQMIFRHVP